MSSALNVATRPEVISAPRNADILGKPPEYLYAEFEKCLASDIDNLIRRGDILREFENRGIRFDKDRLGKFAVMHKLLLGISSGTVLPEVLIRFGASGYRQLTKVISSLPTIDQRQIIREETVEFAVQRPDGEWDTLRVMPEKLSQEQIRQVFSDGRLLGAEAQKQNLKLAELATSKPTSLIRIGNVTINPVNETVSTNGKFVSREAIENALRMMPTKKRK